MTVEPSAELSSDLPLMLDAASGTPELPPSRNCPGHLLIEDKKGNACEIRGAIQKETNQLTLDPDSRWGSALAMPVHLFGNVLKASRGETVSTEILGGGDASMANQSFQLKKKPLTYLPSPTAADDRMVASTLKIRVDGIAWREVPSFFGVGPDEPVYTVRQADQGETVVTFGDGRRGRRLPTGRDNVVADYRFGAGAKAPPAGAVTQLARPVKGLSSVRNPLPAAGGDDAEGAENLREHAPRSALTLGRAVSIDDFQALTAGYPGVHAVRAEWRWHGTRQQAVVQIWYIGAAALAPDIADQLQNLADPTVVIAVERALPKRLYFTLNVEFDPRHDRPTVETALEEALLDPESGLLAAAQVGISRPLFRSRIFQRALQVPGVQAVSSILWSYSRRHRRPFAASALEPGDGRYFEVERHRLTLKLQEGQYG